MATRAVRGRPRVGAGVALAVLLATAVVVLGWQDAAIEGPADRQPPSAVGTDVVAPGTGGVVVQPDPALDRPFEGERAVEPGSAAVAVDGETSERGGSLGRSRPTCDVEGCALWRGTLLGTGPVAVGSRLAVAARDGLVVAVDVDTGQLRWRVPQPVPHRDVRAFHLDERVVAVATGPVVTTLDPRTGSVRGTSAPLPAVVSHLARVDGHLVAAGTTEEGEVVAGLDEDAQVRFVRSGRIDDLSSGTGTPLLVEHGDELLRLDAATGRDRWTVPVDGRIRDGLTLLDRREGRIEVLDAGTGAPLLTQVVTGAVDAGVRSGVLVAVTRDRLVLVGRDGASLGEVAVADPTATVVTAAGTRVTVVEMPSGGSGPRVAVRQVMGAASGLPGPGDAFDIPGTDVLGRELGATRRRDGLLVATDRDAWVVPAGTATAVPVEVPVGERVQHVDGLSVRLLADGLDLAGAGGRIGVSGAGELLSLDPLLVRGPEGTLRLDRTLLDD